MKPVSLTESSEMAKIVRESMTPAGAEVLLLLQLTNLFSQASVPPADSVSSNGAYHADVPSVQKLYQLLVEQIPAVVFLVYLEGGGVSEAYVSPQIEKSLGFTQEEWLEDPIRAYQQIHPDDKTRWSIEAAEMLISGAPLRSVYRVIARDGHVVSLHCEVKMVRTAEGRPWFIHGTAYEITELKKAEEALQQERNFVTAVLDTVGAIVLVLDSEGRVVRFNRAGEQMTGYTLAEIKGKPVWQVFPEPKEVDRFRAMFSQVQASPERQEHESYWLTQAGERRLIAFSGSALPAAHLGASYTILTGIDITERKRLEKRELERQAAKTEETLDLLQRLIDSMSESMFLVDFSGRVKKANRAARELLGAGAKDPVGGRFSDSFSKPLPPNAKIPTSPLQLLQRAPGGKLYLETEIQVSAGQIPLSVSCVLVRDAREKIIGLLLVLQDITERKQTEAALRRTEKLAAAGRLAATIAHEINNPLEAVTNLVYLARTQPGRAREFLEFADQELARVAHIAKQTLGFYRDTSASAPVNVSEAIENVLFLYARRLEARKIMVRKNFAFNPQITGFAGELRQIFSNLISNAIDAIGQDGTLSIKVSPGSSWNNPRTTGVRVTIADTGCGIKPEHLKKIFEPFYTTKQDVGTGLGLWVSRGIIQNHHGSIRFRSTTTRGRSGTVFSVFLPAEGVALAKAG